ncbi:unnamed protein product [Boreogadus saida]
MLLEHCGPGGGAKPASGGGVKPASGGGVKPASGGGVKPAFGGGVKPASGGGVKSASGGGVKPASGGAVKPASGGGVKSASGGGVKPASGGGVKPASDWSGVNEHQIKGVPSEGGAMGPGCRPPELVVEGDERVYGRFPVSPVGLQEVCSALSPPTPSTLDPGPLPLWTLDPFHSGPLPLWNLDPFHSGPQTRSPPPREWDQDSWRSRAGGWSDAV